MARLETYRCDGCDAVAQTDDGFPETWVRAQVYVAHGLSRAHLERRMSQGLQNRDALTPVDFERDLCPDCLSRLLIAADPNKWSRNATKVKADASVVEDA